MKETGTVQDSETSTATGAKPEGIQWTGHVVTVTHVKSL